jgi:hypothetical protein
MDVSEAKLLGFPQLHTARFKGFVFLMYIDKKY